MTAVPRALNKEARCPEGVGTAVRRQRDAGDLEDFAVVPIGKRKGCTDTMQLIAARWCPGDS